MASVSYNDFMKIIEGLTPDQVTRLFGRLGIPLFAILNAQSAAGTPDPRVRAWHVFMEWRDKTGNKATREALLEAKKKEFSDTTSEISHEDIIEITTKLSPDDLKHLYHHLGIPDEDRDHEEASTNTQDTRLKAWAVLSYWTQKLGSEATRERLYAAKEKVTSTPTSGEHHVVAAWEDLLASLYRQDRGDITFIPGTPEHFSSDEFFVELELLKKQELPTAIEYVQLKTYTDLFKLRSTKGKVLDHVLVSGLPGTGKTTLISRLAYQWAAFQEISSRSHRSGSNPGLCTNQEPSSESLECFKSFKLVFALDIRQFHPNEDLVDAIRRQLLPFASKEELCNYLSTNFKHCLFLFDGFDEIGQNTKILSDKRIKASFVIITTRSNQVSNFKLLHHGYVQVALHGFSDMSIEEFVKCFFKLPNGQVPPKTMKFLQVIEKDILIQELCHFPLFLAMMCVLWEDQNSIPSTIGGIYKDMIEYLVRHWKSREQSEASIADFKEQKTLDDILLELGNTGLRALLSVQLTKSQLIFDQKDFYSPDIIENGCCLGLLTKDCTVNRFDMVTNVSFIHKTFQEYCAALYLTNLCENNPQLFKIYLSKMNVEDTEYVLRFTCGMTKAAAKEVLAYVVNDSSQVKKRSEETGTTIELGGFFTDPWRFPLMLLFEAESILGSNKSMHEVIRPLFHSVTFNICQEIFNPNFKQMIQFYTKTSETWVKFVQRAIILYDNHFYKDTTDMLPLLQSFQNLQILKIKSISVACIPPILIESICNNAPSIEVLDFDDKSTCDIADIKAIIHAKPHLTTLSIPPPPWRNPENATILGQVLQIMSARSGSITKMTLTGEDVNDAFMEKMHPFCNSLTKLVIEYTSLTPDGYQTLFEAMTVACQKNSISHEEEANMKSLPLEYLDMSSCNIGDSAYKLAEAMKSLSSLSHLNLNQCNLCKDHFNELDPVPEGAHAQPPSLQHVQKQTGLIGLDGAQSLLASFKHIPQLTELLLSHNNIGSEGAKVLSESFQHISQLIKLDLSHNNIGSDGAQAMSASFLHILELTYLNLSHNNIGSDGAQALSASFQHMQKLTNLDLSHNNIGSDGAQVQFQSMPELEYLDLSHNYVGSDGAQPQSLLFKHMPQLRRLYLSHNNIGSGGTRALSASFEHMQELRRLYLSHNNIESDGAQTLSASFHHMSQLTELNLSHNNIGSDGVQALSVSFQNMPQLIELDFSQNNIESDGAQALPESFQQKLQLSEIIKEGVYGLNQPWISQPLYSMFPNDDQLSSYTKF